MAGKGTASVKIELTGEREFDQAIKRINNDQKQLRSEMKLSESAFKGQANSVEALRSKFDILSKQYESQKEKVKTYQDALNNSAKKEEEAAKKIDTLRESYDKANAELEDLKKSTPEATEEIAKQEQELEQLSNQLKIAEQDYSKAQASTAKYQTSLNYANIELNKLDEELSQTGAYLSEAEKSADGTAKSIDEFGNEAKEAGEETASFGKIAVAALASQVLYSALNKLVDGIKQIGEACIESGSEFEAAMDKVAAVSGAAGGDLDALTDKAKQMGASTMFSASQAAEAMNYMAMAGWKTEDMLSGIEGVMDLAAASGEDLATTSDIVTDALTAFGLTAQDSAHFADVLAAASSNANTNVAMMGETFSYAAPIAGSLGFSVEDTAEAIGLMANAGIKASSAGTSLRRIMTELSKDVTIHSKSMGDMVIKTTEADGSMRELSDILADCRGAFDQLSESEKASAAASIVGKNAMSGFLALMNAAPSDVEKLSNALATCDGTAKAMADTMQDNLKGKITIMQSALEGLAISTYDAFDDSLKEGVEGATEAITRLNDAVVNGDLGVSLERLGESASRLMVEVVDGLVDHMPAIIDGITAVVDNADEIASVIETIVAAWGTYKVAAEGAQAATMLLNAELALNPILAVAAGVAACGVALVNFAKEEAKAGEEALKASKKTSSLVSETRDLTASYNESKEAFKANIDDLNAQGDACNKLVDDLIGLNAQWQDSSAPGFSEAVAEQTSIINELKAAYPGLNLAIDEHTGALNMDAEAIRANIAAMQSQAYAEAAQERLTEIAKQKLELQIQQQKLAPEITEAENALTEAQSAHADAEERLIEIQETWNGDVEAGTEAALAARDAHLEAGHALSELRGEHEACETAIEDLNEEEQILTENLRVNAEASAQAGSSAAGAADGFTQLKLTEEELEEFIENVNKSIDSQINLLERHQEVTAVSGETMQENLASQVEALEQWASDFETLAAKGIDDGLLKQLAEMGPEAEGYIQGLLSMSETQLAEYSTKFAEATKLKSETASEITNSYLDAGTEFGKAVSEGTISGVEETAEGVTEAVETVVDETKDASVEKAQEFTETGEKAMTSTQEGIDRRKDAVTTAIEKVGTEAVETAEKSMGKEQFVPVGANIVAGIVEGIKSDQGKGTLMAEIKAMAEEAVATANATLKIQSPSKVFKEIGEYTMLGMAEGIEASSSAVIDSVNRAMDETAKAGASVVTTPSGMDTNTLAYTVASAIERGLEGFVMNVNAGVDKDAIVKITVDANRDYSKRTGTGLYGG